MIPPFSPENHVIFPKSLTSLPPLYYPFTLCWQWLITLPLLPENHMIPPKCSTPSPPSILPLYTLLAMTDHPSTPPWKPYDSSKMLHPLPPLYITPLHSVGNDWSPFHSLLKTIWFLQISPPPPPSILPLYTLLVMTDHLSNPPWNNNIFPSKSSNPLPSR